MGRGFRLGFMPEPTQHFEPPSIKPSINTLGDSVASAAAQVDASLLFCCLLSSSETNSRRSQGTLPTAQMCHHMQDPEEEGCSSTHEGSRFAHGDSLVKSSPSAGATDWCCFSCRSSPSPPSLPGRLLLSQVVPVLACSATFSSKELSGVTLLIC